MALMKELPEPLQRVVKGMDHAGKTTAVPLLLSVLTETFTELLIASDMDNELSDLCISGPPCLPASLGPLSRKQPKVRGCEREQSGHLLSSPALSHSADPWQFSSEGPTSC